MDKIVSKIAEQAEQPAAGGAPPAPDGSRRIITMSVEAETMEKQLKRATVKAGRGGTFEVWCDESTFVGGDDSAPSPLAYFSLGIAF